uniref:WD_REPEATS_REGION domain-containing protein n=1 Tax=Globodera rostochiensis TaxID=31243 RepID=A0A914HWY1_GLORO
MVNGCQWYPVDSSIFATSGRDKFLKIWDADQLKSVEQFAFQQPISNFHWFVPANCNSSLISIATSSSNVDLLDPRLGNSAQQIRCSRQRIWSVQWVRACDYVLATGSDSGEIAYWDVRSSKNELKKVKSPCGGITSKDDVNGKTIAETDRKRLLNSANFAKFSHSNRIVCLRCSADGRFIVSLSHNRNVCLWKAETMRLLCCLKIPESESDRSTFPVQFELCDEGRFVWLFVPHSNNIVVVKIANENVFGKGSTGAIDQFQILRGHFQSVLSCAYRKEYNQLVTSSTDRLVLVWAPQMDEYRFDSAAQQIKQLHEDAFSDDESRNFECFLPKLLCAPSPAVLLGWLPNLAIWEAAREGEEYFNKLKQQQLKLLKLQLKREQDHHEEQAKHHHDVVERHKKRIQELEEESSSTSRLVSFFHPMIEAIAIFEHFLRSSEFFAPNRSNDQHPVGG